MPTKQHRRSMLLPFVLWAGASVCSAQSYPTKPVRIHTANPGTSAEFVARLLADQMSAPLGQQVVVENRPAGAVLASGVAKAAPDGYILLVTGANLWTAPVLQDMPYDPLKDFATITTATRAPNVLVVTPSLGVKTVADLIRVAKARPGELNFSTGASGSSSHIAGELFKSAAGVAIERIAYKGQADEDADMIAGRVHMNFGVGMSWVAQIRAGKVVALATAGAQRSSLYPDLPTVGETVPGFVAEALFGLWAPAKTPEAVIRRLNQEAVRGLERPEARERLLKVGQEPVGGSPEQLTESMKSDMAKLSRIIQAGGIKRGS